MQNRSNKDKYNDIAIDYSNTSLLPFRVYAEFPTLLNLFGDIRDKSVLDVACGTGVITHLLSKCLPSSITAIDVNSEMLSMAKQNDFGSIPVSLVHGDFCEHQFAQVFDLCVTAFGLNEMNSIVELNTFINSLSRNLISNGKVCIEFDNAIACINHNWKKFGISHYVLRSEKGETFDYQIILEIDKKEIELNCTYFSEFQIRSVLESNGFTRIRFHNLHLSDLGLKELGLNYWKNFDQCSLTRFITAIKQ